jgi:hypothetical protein
MKCPCEECISFAICNAQIKSMGIPSVINHAIYKKCSTLHKFMKLNAEKSFTKFNQTEVNYTRMIFKLPQLINIKETK